MQASSQLPVWYWVDDPVAYLDFEWGQHRERWAEKIAQALQSLHVWRATLIRMNRIGSSTPAKMVCPFSRPPCGLACAGFSLPLLITVMGLHHARVDRVLMHVFSAWNGVVVA